MSRSGSSAKTSVDMLDSARPEVKQAPALSALAAALLVLCIGCTSDPSNTPESAEESALGTQSDQQLFQRARASLRAAGVERLRWGLTPYVAPDEIIERYSPIIDWVSERVGIDIDIHVGDSYQDLERQIIEGRIDIAVLGPYAYVGAQSENPDIRVFASHVALGSTTYGTYILTHDDSGIESLEDLRDRDFAFVDRLSTSGWLSPAAHLLERGINPVSEVRGRYLGSHEQVFDAVAANQVAAGAVYSASVSEGRRRNPMGNHVRILAKCARIPYDAYTLRAGLEEVVGAALARALSEISTRDRRGRQTLKSLARINGFIPVDDRHYDVIRQLEARVVKGLGPAAESDMHGPSSKQPSGSGKTPGIDNP